jgi:nitrite reductase/ring-hydroxylating ferredoxin subunit
MSEDNFFPSIENAELPDESMKSVVIAGRTVLLARHNGEVFGVSNKCPHMGCSLSNGNLKGYVVTCPCHGWSFDIRNGFYEHNKAIALTTYECKIDNGKIHVKIINDM